MREAADGSLKLTVEETANGWDEQAILAYQAQREKSHSLVAGNIVTQFVRPAPPFRVENCKAHNPHSWSKRNG